MPSCECVRYFSTPRSLLQHQQDKGHGATHFHCLLCDRDFVNERALEQHLEDKVHPSQPTSRSFYVESSSRVCYTCNRIFVNEKALQQHLSSVVHNPLCRLDCIGNKECGKNFTSPSAMVMHLESGACCSGINKQTFNRLIRSSDVHGIMCGGNHLAARDILEHGDSFASSVARPSPFTTPTEPSSHALSRSLSGSSVGTAVLTPRSGSSRYSPDEISYDLMCRLSLTTSTPVHPSDTFHCPLALTAPSLSLTEVEKATKSFSTVSGLIQHLESGACVGGKAVLRTAMKYVEAQLRERGLERWQIMD
jgi:hypothetical protein